ncbi:MAG: 2Fe-2S iron-sulfur cluster-binding protein [Nanoarchaeota archaeon]
MSRKIKIEIKRSIEGKEEIKTYVIPHVEKMRVLGAIRYIQENIEGDLAFRWNCGEGICGSCAIEMDGQPILACKTEIPEETNKITLGPLKAFPVVKDFVFDRSKVDRQARRIKPYFITNNKEKDFWRMHEIDIKDSAEMRTCIDCLICHDSCHVLRDTDLKFLGPRNIVKATSLEKHPMNSFNRSELLKKEGSWNCNVTRCCTDNCPQGIQITQNAIIPLKEKDVSSELIPIWKLFKKKKG